MQRQEGVRAENSEEARTADLQVCGLCDEAERYVGQTNLYCKSYVSPGKAFRGGWHVRLTC